MNRCCYRYQSRRIITAVGTLIQQQQQTRSVCMKLYHNNNYCYNMYNNYYHYYNKSPFNYNSNNNKVRWNSVTTTTTTNTDGSNNIVEVPSTNQQNERDNNNDTTNNNNNDTYQKLYNEYNNRLKQQIQSISLSLYRTILRSIIKHIQYGNQYDIIEFEKREYKQQQQQLLLLQQQSYNTKNDNTDLSESFSLLDTLPINRYDELQSRKNYYIQYTKENFIANSDLFHDLIQPKKQINRDSNNNYTNIMNQNQNQSQYNLIQYNRIKEEQYYIVKQYIHYIQQGYQHYYWLLKDMKFDINTIMNTTVHNQQQQHYQVQLQQLETQLHDYIDRVLQYNFNMNPSIITTSQNHQQENNYSTTVTPMFTTGGDGTQQQQDDNKINDDIWSDDEE